MHITRRELHIGPHTLASDRADKGAAPYLLSGPHLYVIGRGSGDIAPLPGEHHIPNEMGGVWAHPLKVAEGLLAVVCDAGGAPIPADDAAFEERLSDVAWRWRAGAIAVERRDAVAPIARPALLAHIRLHNTGDAPFAGELHLHLDLKFVPAWRSGLRSGGGAYGVEGAWLLGRDRGAPDRWGMACGTGAPPASYRLEQHGTGCAATLVYRVALKAGAAHEWHFALAAESERGADAARHTCAALVKDDGALFAQQQGYGRPALRAEADDAGLTRDVDLAQANLRLLHADYAALGAYFLAGLPEYPQLFGCDTTYSVPGALAAGYVDVTRSALLRLAKVAQEGCARFPHELTTNGRVFHPGNIQETPQFVIACWDFVRWTGDIAFGRELLPLCREALDEFVAGASWPDGLYPYGDGMVERLGMGGRKLDSVCYHYAALQALADLCDALGEGDASAYRARAATLKARFTADWWFEDQGLYADSMDIDGTLHFDGHWTVALPLQLGLAEGERAARMWARIEREWVNEWGLIHTRGAEPLVWTLPTGLLALAAFEHGRAALGLKLVENIALTARVGTLGTFKELIPEGLCFVQLWSAGLYLQGVVEGLFGVRPMAHQHRVELRPCLPDGWGSAALNGVRVGEHTLNLVFEGDALHVKHVSGPQPIVVAHRGGEATVEVGQPQRIERRGSGSQT